MDINQSLDPKIFAENRLPSRSLFTSQKNVKEVSLDGLWNFLYYDNPSQASSSFLEKKKIDEMGEIEVPAHFPLQGYGTAQYTNTVYPWDGLSAIRPPQIPEDNPTGCYAKVISLTPQECEKEIIIRFDGVDSALYLYVNGKYVGYKEDSFSPGEFLISPYVHAGENLISVMVVRYCTGSWLEDQDFWRLPGIFRSVTLLFCEKKRITDVFIRPTLDDDFSIGRVSLAIKTATDGDFSTRILIGNEVYHEKEFSIKSPLLWSAEEPHLYNYTLELREQGSVVDVVTGHFGFRKIEIRGRTIYLNGKRLIIRGVNRHEFDPYKGRAIDKELIKKDLLMMKQNNINALRTSHYPNHPYVYHLCDILGIYVMDEVNLETHGTWMVGGIGEKKWYTLPDDKEEWRGAVLDRAISMAMRDKNHPSILFYSCGNESSGGSIIHEVATYFRSLDDNRLIHYEGVYFDRRYDDTSDVESRMYAKVEEVREYLKTGSKPFLLCEYAHAMGNSVGNLDEYVALEDESEAYSGGFIWDFVDQSLIIDQKEYAGLGFSAPTDGYFCINGLVDGLRNRSAKLEQVAYSYRPVDILIGEKTVEIKNKNLFISTALYSFNYTYTLDGKVVQRGVWELEIAPLSSISLPIPVLEKKERGEYQLVVRVCLQEEMPWAPKGHVVVSVGKVIAQVASKREEIVPAPLIKGDMHTGYRYNNFSFLIHHHFGHIVAIQHKLKNMLTSPIKIEFWRAPTDNDRGVNPIFPYASCKLASMYQVAKNFRIEGAVVYTTIQCGPYNVDASYRFNTNKVVIEIEPPPFDSFIPCFGLSFSVDSSYRKVSYYGNEMLESYRDRKGGNVLSRVLFDPYKDQRSYLHPQEYGNRFDTRSLTLANKEGRGIRMQASKPFECSVVPYSCHELENATYRHDLPQTDYLHVRLLEGQSGVGGDDSWGAPIHEKYRYYGPQEKWVVEIEVFE